MKGNWFSSRQPAGKNRAKPGRGRRLFIEQLERRDMLTGTWTQLANSSPVGSGTMDLLTNGSVLMTNGGNEWAILTPNSSGSYVNGTWTRSSNANFTRLYDSTQVLQNGQVFVAGGEYGTGADTGELYNPLTNTWTTLPSQPYGSFIDSISMLVTGGSQNGNVLIAPVYPSQSGYTTIFNTTTDTWSQGTKLYRGGDADEQGWVKLPDGSILTVDGASTSERYIPASNSWVNDGAVPEDLYDSLGEEGPALLLDNGQAIFFGATSTSVIYTPSGSSSPGTFTAGPAIPGGNGCDDASGAVLRDGTVLLATGPSGTYNGPTTFYTYNPTTNSFSTVPNQPSFSGPSFETRMLALPDGNVLVLAGGLYEYDPGTTAAAAAVPSISGITQNSNGSFLLTGTGLNGLDAGAAYGDDCQMDSNYPIVQLVNGSNVYYATTNNWSTTGVQTGSASETVDFTLPLGIPAGTYSVYAVANGIPSSPDSLTLPTTSDTGPTVATPASASATTVTGTTVNLSVLGADPLGASGLVYTWTTTTTSNNIQLPSLSDNGDNTAQNVTATFHQAGRYTFKATITDTAGLSTTSSVTVTVAQTYSGATVSPALASIGGGGTEQFSASAYDQFGNALTSQPSFTWSLTSGTGSVNSSGKYTATSSGTLATITATGTKSGSTYSNTGQVGVVSSPWNSTDIGSVGETGTAYDNGTTFTVEGSGSDIWGTSDEFHFVYQTMTGDGVIIAHVASLTDTGGWAKVGVMFRNSLSSGDQYALECITPSNGSAFQYRTTSGGSAAGTSGDSGPAAPYWVKLVRSGNTITGYRSSDGNAWIEDGSETIAFTNTTIYVGLEVDANNNSALNSSTFDNVTLLVGGNSAPTVSHAAAAATNPVTGTSVALSVLGADTNGESHLTYSWTATTVPSSAAAPNYGANGTNAAKSTTATFTAAGSYVFQVTITNEYGLTTTSSVNVTVNQTPSGALAVFPATPTLLPSQTCQMQAFETDQFGAPIVGSVAASWSVSPSSGAGTISAGGLYTAPASGTTATVTATVGNSTANAAVQVIQPNDYWKFNDGSGTTAIDSGSGGHNGTLVGSATWTTGVLGGALAFNGTSQNVSVPTLNLSSNTVTITAWIYRAASESSFAGIFFDRNSSSGATGLNFGTANELRYTWNNSASTYNWNSGLVVPSGQWTFAALVITATSATMYMEPVGGTLQSATNAVANSASTFSGTSDIGWDSGYSNRYFVGTLDDVRFYNTSLTSAAIASIATLPPTLATAAAASPSPVTGTTTALSVLGADYGGAANLSYTWSAAGPAAVSFSANGTNAAHNTTATFSKVGSYTITATITDLGGLSATSSVNVTVNLTLSSIAVTPANVSLGSDANQQFSAEAYDQFGNALASQPAFTWVVASGVGSISANGLYTASYASESAAVTASSGGITSSAAAVTVTDAAPTVATPAAATPGTVTESTTALSVLGADSDGGGESNLTYTWATTGTPPAAVSFSANGTNTAQNTTATFAAAGTYTFQVTITDMGGESATSSVDVTVNQTLTGIAVTPAPASLGSDATQQFAATAYDQFGNALVSQPTFTWAVASGVGNIDSASGLYTAPYASGSATVTATSGGITSNAAAVTVTDAAPTVATTAAASPSPVTGTTVALSVLGADSDGGGESNLTYTWATTGTPPAAVGFSANGTNAAKNTTATFTAAGDYTFQVTITDMGGESTTSSVSVTVNQTLTSIAVTPASVSLGSDANQQFAATAYDQFGDAMLSQPTFTWAVASGVGSIDSASGLYTASYASGSATVTANSGGVTSNAASVTVTDAAPTVATAAAASPSPVTGTTVALSVLGADSDGGGESNLTYTWATTGTPPAAVSFSANGTNDAQNTTATFAAAGDYTFQVTITDMGGLSTTSSVEVTVNQTLTSIAVGPTTASITAGGTQQFAVTGQDQFGQALDNPSVTWSLTGPGALSSSGLYSPAYSPGTAMVQAASGPLVSTASVTISGQAEWNASADASWGASGSWADSISAATIAAPGVRGIAGDTVLFATAAAGVATLDGASPTLAGITFNNATTSYTIAQGTGGSIALQSSGGATVSVLAGTHAISAPLGLMSDTTFAVASGGSLTVSGDISGSGSLTESGGGILKLSGANSDAGGTSVLSGKLIVMDADSLADGSNVTVGDPSYFAAVTPSTSTAAAPASTRPASPPASPAVPPAAPKRAAVAHVLSVVTPAPTVSVRAASAAVWLVPGFAANAGTGPNRGPFADLAARARDAIFLEYGQLASTSRSA